MEHAQVQNLQMQVLGEDVGKNFLKETSSAPCKDHTDHMYKENRN
jgi:hypothetical protein